MAPSHDTHEPVPYGASIDRHMSATPTLAAGLPAVPHSNASTMTTATAEAVNKELAVDSSNPYSAFYKHPDARRSLDTDAATPTKTHLDVTTYERDLESGAPLSAATTQQLAKTSVDGRVKEAKECTMWPSRQAVLDKRRAHKRRKGCNLFKGLSSKQRLWIKIIIAMLVVGAAVGLGVGISRAVGGGVWAGDGRSKEIPHN